MPSAAAKKRQSDLVRVATAVAAWLERLGDQAEQCANETAGHLPAQSEAHRADARNVRAAARDLRRALAAEETPRS